MEPKRLGKKCDLVMKGGVTSAVVYPKAISELSKEYHFRASGEHQQVRLRRQWPRPRSMRGRAEHWMRLGK